MDFKEFENEFINIEEIEERDDAILSAIAEQAEAEDNMSAIINPEKMKAILFTYKILKYMTEGTKAKVTCQLNKPYKSMASISVIGKNVMFKESKWFSTALKLASNFDVYPKTNGTIQIDFTFHGLTEVIE